MIQMKDNERECRIVLMIKSNCSHLDGYRSAQAQGLNAQITMETTKAQRRTKRETHTERHLETQTQAEAKSQRWRYMLLKIITRARHRERAVKWKHSRREERRTRTNKVKKWGKVNGKDKGRNKERGSDRTSEDLKWVKIYEELENWPKGIRDRDKRQNDERGSQRSRQYRRWDNKKSK